MVKKKSSIMDEAAWAKSNLKDEKLN